MIAPEHTPTDPGDTPDASLAEVTCCACAHVGATSAGHYALPTKSDAQGRPTTMSYPLVACTSCGHVQAHPPPDEDAIAAYYRSGFWDDQGAGHEDRELTWAERVTEPSGMWERNQRAARQIGVLTGAVDLPSTARVIDLGSGWSPLLHRLAELGFTDLHALEPSPEVCAFLERQGVTTWPMLLDEFLARDDVPKFDAMVISHTVEHLADPQPLLRGLADRLTPNGVLYVDVPFRDDLRPHHQGLHLQFFQESSMRPLLERSGLDVVTLETDRLNPLERAMLAALHAVYGRTYKGKGGVSASGRLEKLHRRAWRPLRRVLPLEVNIHISSQDLRVLARPSRR